MTPVREEFLRAWCEVSRAALRTNVATLRSGLAAGALLGIVVKSDAYGHGLVLCAREFVAAGADWLVVNSLDEAVRLRRAGLVVPLYICAQVAPFEASLAVESGARIVLCDADTARALAASARQSGVVLRCHIKVETGTHRQGIGRDELPEFARLVKGLDGLEIEGLTTHFADIEEAADRSFSEEQMRALSAAASDLRSMGIDVPMVHAANSAAALLWPETHGSLVRAGIAAYGLWPSNATHAVAEGRSAPLPRLYPALSWKARIAQVKTVPVGGTIGYGRTFRTRRSMRIGIVPVGYYEGYDRRMSNRGHVLVEGARAPVRGRVCMNMFMIDLTDVPQVRTGQVVTLLGAEGSEDVGAQQWASWMNSIHYEAISRIHPEQPRLLRAEDGLLYLGEDAKAYE